jgi:hypothetical protein
MVGCPNDDQKVIFELCRLFAAPKWNEGGRLGLQRPHACVRRRFSRTLAPLRLCITPPNCETNPISFKTCCPSKTNNKKISLFAKTKSYDDGQPTANLDGKPKRINNTKSTLDSPERPKTKPEQNQTKPFFSIQPLKASQAWSRLLKATQGKNNNHFFILPLRQRARKGEDCRGDECPAGK